MIISFYSFVNECFILGLQSGLPRISVAVWETSSLITETMLVPCSWCIERPSLKWPLSVEWNLQLNSVTELLRYCAVWVQQTTWALQCQFVSAVDVI